MRNDYDILTMELDRAVPADILKFLDIFADVRLVSFKI